MSQHGVSQRPSSSTAPPSVIEDHAIAGRVRTAQDRTESCGPTSCHCPCTKACTQVCSDCNAACCICVGVPLVQHPEAHGALSGVCVPVFSPGLAVATLRLRFNASSAHRQDNASFVLRFCWSPCAWQLSIAAAAAGAEREEVGDGGPQGRLAVPGVRIRDRPGQSALRRYLSACSGHIQARRRPP